MQQFYQKSKNAIFVCGDYADVLKKTKKSDIIYCDPPYVPLSATAHFTRYSRSDFTLEQQQDLANWAVKLSRLGRSVVLSNHVTEFTREVYCDAKIISFSVPRFISCKVKNRKPVEELLAIFS